MLFVLKYIVERKKDKNQRALGMASLHSQTPSSKRQKVVALPQSSIDLRLLAPFFSLYGLQEAINMPVHACGLCTVVLFSRCLSRSSILNACDKKIAVLCLDRHIGHLCLLLVLLHVLVGEESEGTADQDDRVEADAHVGLAGAAGAGLRAGSLLGLCGRVVGLWIVMLVWWDLSACAVNAL